MKPKNYKKKIDTPWRRTTLAIYRPPVDGRIYGTFEMDMTKALAFEQKKKKEGVPLTTTHILGAATGRAISQFIPEINAYVRRGKIIERPSVDVFLSVFMPRTGEMTGFPIQNIDKKPISALPAEIKELARQHRDQQKEKGAVKNKHFLSKIPWPFRLWIFRLIRFVTVTLGFSLPFMKVNPSSFGSAMLSNIGSHGLQFGMAALLPASNLPIVLIMGKVEKKPVVRDGEIVIRDILPLTATLDHRIVDGAQGGKLAKGIDHYLQNPELLDEPVTD